MIDINAVDGVGKYGLDDVYTVDGMLYILLLSTILTMNLLVIVIYDDSVMDSNLIEGIYESNKDSTVEATLSGNTIKEILDGNGKNLIMEKLLEVKQ